MRVLFHLLVCLCAAAHVHGAPRPNIILCMADDMGWGDPSYYSSTVVYPDGTPHPDQGWIQTPNLDAMAANGLRFDRFYAASAVCSPTRASCLTGRHPFRVGVPFANSGRLGFEETPLSEVLSAAGYRCGHFGKWHLGSMTTLRADSNRGGNAAVYSAPWHHGYDSCFATESKLPTYHPYRKADNNLALPSSFADPNFYGTYYWRMPGSWNPISGEGDPVPVNEVNNLANGDDSKLLVDQAIPFLQEAANAGEPFFLVLWFHTPHKPLVDPAGLSAVDSSDAVRDSIEDMDLAIGRIRTELDTLGVRGNTMFWVTSDNGPEDGDNSPNETSTARSIRSGRFLERKRSLHEGGVRVPGILEWPDLIPTGRGTDLPAITTDYYPTILDFLELSVPNQKPLDGISLRPVIEGTATTRTRPLGFLISGDRSWMNQQYKLIDDGSGWELYDLVNSAPGEETEQTPLATAGNLGSRPLAIQEIYNTMLAEFTAWNATVVADVPFVHASQPTVTLTGPAQPVTGPFTVDATFPKPVAHLHAHEFIVTNGSPTSLTGGGTNWSLTITPLPGGPVEIALPEGSANDADGNPNAPAALTVLQAGPPSAEVIPVVTSLPLMAGQTVDRLDTVPGDGSNNQLKFTANTLNDGVANPFTTTLYTRSATGSESNPRTVRAFVRFDLSGLPILPVASATLHFTGHSLNDIASNNSGIEAVALGAAWSDSGPPLPTFDHPTTGLAASGGSVMSGLDPVDHTRTYQFDVTSIAQNWASAPASNHGLQIRLTDLTVNNGVGIKSSGANAIELVIQQQPLVLQKLTRGPTPVDVTVVWTTTSGAAYRIEASSSLHGPWDEVAVITGGPGSTTSYTHVDAMINFPERYYRIAYPAD